MRGMREKIGKKVKITLLVTVSASALLLAGARGVEAQEGKFWLELSGQALFWNGGANQYFFLPGNQIKPKSGLAFSGEIGYQFADSPWSFAVRGKYGASKKRTHSYAGFYGTYYYSGYAGARVKAKEKLAVIDFEVGRDIGLGSSDATLKVKAGIRFASFKATESGSWYVSTPFYIGYGTGRNKRTFKGIGPRLGFEAKIPAGDSLALKMNAGAALLFGKRKASGTYFNSYYGTTTTVRRSKSTVVPNLDAFIGVAFTPTSSPIELTVGYGVDAYFNVLDSGFFTAKKSNRIIHGPQAKLKISF